MPEPALFVTVRFRSRLSLEEVEKIAEERAPDFRALEGLLQKYYLQDSATGEYMGVYLWRSAEDFAAYRDSELRATIVEAYQAEGEPRVEAYRRMMTLRED